MVSKENEQAIKPFTARKAYTGLTATRKIWTPHGCQKHTMQSMEAVLKQRTKDWSRSDDEDSKKCIEQMYWNALL